jgi:hypothetical protein
VIPAPNKRQAFIDAMKGQGGMNGPPMGPDPTTQAGQLLKALVMKQAATKVGKKPMPRHKGRRRRAAAMIAQARR